jgi:hypothetical protein
MPADSDDDDDDDDDGGSPKSHTVYSCSEEQEEAHHHQSRPKHTKRALFFEELDTLSPREVEQPVEKVPFTPDMSPLRTARRSHRHRFTNRLTN